MMTMMHMMMRLMIVMKDFGPEILKDELRFFAIDPYCDMYKKKKKNILTKMII